MKKIILVLLVALSFSTIYSQEATKKEIKGTKLFSAFSLEESIAKFNEVGVENLTTDGLRNLADAHRYLFQTAEAETHYGSLVTRSDNKAEDLYMYAEVLLMNKKTAEWKEQMEKFHARLESDGRGKDFAKRKGIVTELKEDDNQFDSIKNLAINSKNEDFGTSFYEDKVVFTSSREHSLPLKREWNWTKMPYLNLYATNQTDDHELIDLDMMNKSVNKKYHEGPASYSKDGSLMVFTRNNYESKSSEGRVKLKMFYRNRDDKGKWGDIMPFTFNNQEYSVGQPALTPDGKTCYFTSDMPGGHGETDIYRIKRVEDGWTEPENLGAQINTEGREMFPTYHKDGILFFASSGHVGLGGLDIYVSKVSEGKLSDPKNLGFPINDSKDDFSFSMDDSQTYGYFSSNRPGGKGSDDIYSFLMNRPFTFCQEIRVIAKDNEGALLPGTELVVTNSKGEEVDRVTVGDNAEHVFCVDGPDRYTINGTKNDYKAGKTTVTTTANQKAPVKAEVILGKGFELYGIVTDKGSKAPLGDVAIRMTNKLTGASEVITTPAAGDFLRKLTAKLNDNIAYDFELSKAGYLPKNFTYTKTLDKYGRHIVPVNLLAMVNEVNADEVVEINEIYFDFDQSFIRPDAAQELDKIVALMNKYEDLTIELGSHTDCRATKVYNEALSSRRATSSANYIKARLKSNPSRIYGKGYGESRLLNRCACEPTNVSDCSKEEHQKNRRTEFKIIKKGDYEILIKNNSPISF